MTRRQARRNGAVPAPGHGHGRHYAARVQTVKIVLFLEHCVRIYALLQKYLQDYYPKSPFSIAHSMEGACCLADSG
jgi:hypothetical protein